LLCEFYREELSRHDIGQHGLQHAAFVAVFHAVRRFGCRARQRGDGCKTILFLLGLTLDWLLPTAAASAKPVVTVTMPDRETCRYGAG
jgi:hypothetical protein